MPSTFRPQNYKWQHDGKSTYAPRFDKKDWEKHENNIKTLHAEGRTKKEIIEVLDTNHGFRPSYCQIRTRLDKWFPRARYSVETSLPLTSLPENRVSTLKSCLNILDRHLHLQRPTPKSIVHPAQDEEQVFRIFTSILDESSEENINSSNRFSPSGIKRRRLDQSQSQPKKTSDAQSASFTPPGNHTLQNIAAPTSEANTKQIDVTGDIAVDSEDEGVTDSGPMLANRWSASTDSKSFQEYSTQLWPDTRKRRRCYYGSGHDLDISRVPNETRKRLRCICCTCGMAVHSMKCKNCQHALCKRCRST